MLMFPIVENFPFCSGTMHLVTIPSSMLAFVLIWWRHHVSSKFQGKFNDTHVMVQIRIVIGQHHDDESDFLCAHFWKCILISILHISLHLYKTLKMVSVYVGTQVDIRISTDLRQQMMKVLYYFRVVWRCTVFKSSFWAEPFYWLLTQQSRMYKYSCGTAAIKKTACIDDTQVLRVPSYSKSNNNHLDVVFKIRQFWRDERPNQEFLGRFKERLSSHVPIPVSHNVLRATVQNRPARHDICFYSDLKFVRPYEWRMITCDDVITCCSEVVISNLFNDSLL